MTVGRLIAVVGPSGAGKDSLLRYARAFFADDARIVFPRRVITRPADTTAEGHESIDNTAFDALVRRGAFALTWEAHSLKYGVRKEIGAYLRRGNVVAINLSRAIVAEAAKLFPRPIVAEIVASPEVLAARIAARGRESAEDALRRSQRDAPPFPSDLTVHTIRNDGDLHAAGRAFCTLLERALEPALT